MWLKVLTSGCRSLALALTQLPGWEKFAAVYALRNASSKEVLKYGCTGNMRARIFGNYIGGVGGSTTQRIHKELFTNGMIEQVEIAWEAVLSQAEAKGKESECRSAYKAIHGRRPSWDLMD